MKVFELKLGLHPNSGFSCSLNVYLVKTSTCHKCKHSLLISELDDNVPVINLLLLVDGRQRIVLVIDPEGNPGGSGAPTLDDDVFRRRSRSTPVTSESQAEGEQLVVRRALVPEELLRGDEVSRLLHGLKCDRLLKRSRLCVDLWHTILHRLPVVLASVEVAGDHALEIAWSSIAVGGVAEAEAGSATKVVVHVDLEVARPASVALSPLNVLLADTLTVVRITIWPISKTALDHAFTRLATKVS